MKKLKTLFLMLLAFLFLGCNKSSDANNANEENKNEEELVEA